MSDAPNHAILISSLLRNPYAVNRQAMQKWPDTKAALIDKADQIITETMTQLQATGRGDELGMFVLFLIIGFFLNPLYYAHTGAGSELSPVLKSMIASAIDMAITIIDGA